MANCRSCGAEIIWGIHPVSGKRIPLNAKPEKRFIQEDHQQVFSLVDTYQTHFATCPDADKFRKKK